MKTVECDYCGDEFDEAEKDCFCAENDECVCPDCAITAHEQYKLMGIIKKNEYNE